MSDNTSRNKHGDFPSIESSRPRARSNPTFTYTQTASPGWTFGAGANRSTSTAAHIPIDPHEPNRPPILNYKLLISSVAPRPIAFLSTISGDGIPNLAPYSYFNLMNHDPPLFAVGIASSLDYPKDTLRNLLETKQATINIISDAFIEAANATAVNCPEDVSEWDVSGLTMVRDCRVRPARVKEAVVSIEAELVFVKEWESRAEAGKVSGTMVVLEGTRFWVREDAINEERSVVDPAVLQPIGRMGGITYSRTVEGFELVRAKFEEDLGGRAGLERLKRP